MAYLQRQDRSLREVKIKSGAINKGARTIDSAWVIDNDESSDTNSVSFNTKSGVKSSKGKVIQNYVTSTLSGYTQCRGGVFFNTYIVCAFSNGTTTKLYALKDGVYTLIPGAANSFNATNIMDFAVAENTLYMVDGVNVIRYWDGVIANSVTDLTAASGTVPVGATRIRYWKNRLWVCNTTVNANEVVASAEYDYDWWNTATGNPGGDKAFSVVVDDVRAYPMLDMQAALSTISFIKGNGIWILVGDNEANWAIRQLNISDGALCPRSSARGMEAIFYLSDTGVKAFRGTQSLDSTSRYDTVETLSLSLPVKNLFDELVESKRTSSFGCVFQDVYRLNFEDFVYRYNQIANNGEGAIELDYDVETTIGAYVVDNENGRLFGIERDSGNVYQLSNGQTNYTWQDVDSVSSLTGYSATGGTQSLDSTAGHFVYVAGVKLTMSGAGTGYISKTVSLDLLDFDLINSDYFSMYVYLQNLNISNVRVRFITSSGNYYTITNSGPFSVGLQELIFSKSVAAATGSPDWANITSIQLEAVSTAANEITFNLLRQRNAGSYEKSFTTKSFGGGDVDEFIKNMNEIRVWGRVNGSYLVNVDYYIDDSSTASGTIQIDLSDRFLGYYMVDDGKGTAAGINYITDTSKAWTANAFIDMYVYTRADNQIHLITGNTADTLYIEGIGLLYSGPDPATDWWYGKDYVIVPDMASFYTADTTDDTATYYGGGFDNVEFKGRPFLRGKRLKLKFYTTEANQEFEIFGYQFVWEVLQHKP
jgi:hypothetical protein